MIQLLLLFLPVSICVAIHGLGMVVGLRRLGYKVPAHPHHFSLPAMFWIVMPVLLAKHPIDPRPQYFPNRTP